MQHLPACIYTSINAATFYCCKPCNKRMHQRPHTWPPASLFCELHPVLIVNDAPISDNDDSIEYIQCMQHTINRTTNLVMDNLPAEIAHYFPIKGTPASYLSLLNEHQPGSLGHECALAILCALKQCISFTFSPTLQHKTHPTSIWQMTSLTSSATFLPLQLHLVYFRPEAISETSLHSSIHSSKVNKLLPTPLTDNKAANDQPTHLGSFSLIAITHSPLVNGFGNPTTGISPRSSLVARYLISDISRTPTPCLSIYQDHQWWRPRFATYQHHSWPSTSSWYAPQLPLFCLPNGYTTNNWATQQCSPTNKSCHHLSTELCDLSTLIYKSSWTDQHPWWKQPKFFHQISLHSNSY